MIFSIYFASFGYFFNQTFKNISFCQIFFYNLHLLYCFIDKSVIDYIIILFIPPSGASYNQKKDYGGVMKISDKYIDQRFERTIFLSFIYSLAIFTAAFLTSYLIFGSIIGGSKYVLTSPFYLGDTFSIFYSSAHALAPAFIILCILFLSAITPFGSFLSALCLIWRGACLGCTVAAVARQALLPASRWTICAVILYFLSSVLLFVLSSLTSVYRKMLSCAYFCDEPGTVVSLFFELIKLFLVISGTIYSISLFTIILLHTR